MNCTNCGAQLGADTKFCDNCGTPVAAPAAPAAPQAPYAPQQPVATPPAVKFRTDRSFIKTLLLSIVTLGIYPIVMYCHMGDEINVICTPHDGEKTMNYFIANFLLGPITLMIYSLVWNHKFCNRIGRELARRNIAIDFSAKTMWIFGILLSFTIVCPIIYVVKMLKAMNAINESYNAIG